MFTYMLYVYKLCFSTAPINHPTTTPSERETFQEAPAAVAKALRTLLGANAYKS